MQRRLTSVLVLVFVAAQFMGLCLAAAPSLIGEWRTFGNGMAHTGYFPGRMSDSRLVLAWEKTLDTSVDLQQVAVGQGRVYVSPYRYPTVTDLWALDEQTGEQVWNRKLPEASSINPPTYVDGYIYLQRGNHGSDSQVLCLNASTGVTRWSAPFSAQWDHHYAPAVGDGRVWVRGGGYGGVQANRQTDGAQLFFTDLEQYDYWTPTIYNGKIYTFTKGIVREFGRGSTATQANPEGWGERWKLDLGWEWNGYEMNSVAVAHENRIYLVGNHYLAAVSIATGAEAWRKSHPFKYAPAVANGVVYAIFDKKSVRAYRASDGEFLGTYAADTELKWNVIVTDDVLVCSSDTKTYVFNLANFQVLQTLPHGGPASISNNRLFLAGQDGVMRAYRFAGAEPFPNLVFPQFVNGAAGSTANRTRIILRNNCGTADTGTVQFQDPNGLPASVEIAGQPVSELNYSLGPWSTFDVSTDGTGTLQSGSVAVLSDRRSSSKIEGTEIFDLLGKFVCIDATPLRAAHQVYVSRNQSENTGVAIYNPNEYEVQVDVELLASTGIRAGFLTLTLAPGQRISCFIQENPLFSAYFASNTAPFHGTLNIWARDGNAISVTGLIQKASDGALLALPSSPNPYR